MTHTQTRDVQTTMKYVVRGEKATFYAGDRERSYWPGDERQITIHDLRPHSEELALERNGFVLVDRSSGIADYTDADQLATYCRQTEALVQALTGADKVVSFGPIIRTSASGTHGHNQPAFGAHVDYGARTVADYTRDLLPAEEAERRLAKRHMLINVWRPILPVESAPLALCDARTVTRDDLFDSEIIGGLGGASRSLWGFNLAYNPEHKWYWVPQMQPSEALAFKLFDSERDAVQFTAHSAFQDTTALAGAAPRQSVELRTIAYLD
ncbi:CmcJ/NvfI family oxidoreductase [Alteraurantiacibacter aestuarii]|uniref:Methyltransferase n=1 Tax=Alteraurantiacibacter aestuarii TaxID=650004 RepID=A0A844ZLQ6_9SPHN|nr:CmcJ/NvfI family oxidoreductase [Alteraurantiacibacter aestuarii]MXO88504.1 methyltransferase [Alteraurantiacibacter aestuarii]